MSIARRATRITYLLGRRRPLQTGRARSSSFIVNCVLDVFSGPKGAGEVRNDHPVTRSNVHGLLTLVELVPYNISSSSTPTLGHATVLSLTGRPWFDLW